MPDWRAIVRAHLGDSRMQPTTELDVIEELSQHLEDRYRQLLAEGMTPEEAARTSEREIDVQGLAAELGGALEDE